MKNLFLACFASLSCSLSFAYELSQFKSYTVKPGHQMFTQIESTVNDIFASRLNTSLCSLFQSPYNLSLSMGLTLSGSEKIIKNNCSDINTKTDSIHFSKIFTRQYIMLFDPHNSLPIDSWTTFDNKTYIVVGGDFNKEKLKSILVHELAISMDAKFSMMYTSYISSSDQSSKTIAINSDDSQVQNYMSIFNTAAKKDYAYVFSIMRAFNTEKHVNGQNMDSALDHQVCVDEFKQYSEIYHQSIKYIKFDQEESPQVHFQQMLLDIVSNKNFVNAEDELKLLLDEKSDFKLNGKNVSFCQYMAQPMFSGKSHYSFLSNGPRPRIGGGWSEARSQDIDLELKSALEADFKN